MTTHKPACVTGASGFVAAHVIRELLERGYRVRGTVRGLSTPRKKGFLTSLPGAADRLELVSAELLAEGSYDSAVAGCDVVIHTASPYVMNLGKVMRYDNAKIRRELGVQFRPARESVVAAVEDLVRWGHLAKAA